MSQAGAPPRWSEVTALFGGTFDPPHLGHEAAVRGLLTHPGVRAVRVLPSPSPPHKPCVATASDRVALARAAFEGRDPAIRLDLTEVERQENGRPSYTFDTLTLLRRELPKLAFVIGADQLERLPSWHRFPELLSLAHWIVLERHPEGTAQVQAALRNLDASGLVQPAGDGLWALSPPGGAQSGSRTFLKVVPTDAPALSSTQIREAIARTGTPPAGALSPAVHAHLKLHRIYGTNPK